MEGGPPRRALAELLFDILDNGRYDEFTTGVGEVRICSDVLSIMAQLELVPRPATA